MAVREGSLFKKPGLYRLGSGGGRGVIGIFWVLSNLECFGTVSPIYSTKCTLGVGNPVLVHFLVVSGGVIDPVASGHPFCIIFFG